MKASHLLLGALALASALGVSNARSDEAAGQSGGATAIVERMDPRLKPEYVALLKTQAAAYKVDYQNEQKAFAELKAKQAKEHDDLIQSLRDSRHKFMETSHARDERSMFFRGQRQEMNDLVDRQKSELAAFEANRKKELEAFHANQRKERVALERQLATAKR